MRSYDVEVSGEGGRERGKSLACPMMGISASSANGGERLDQHFLDAHLLYDHPIA